MKKSTIILILSGFLVCFYIKYFSKKKSINQTPLGDVEYQKVGALYKGTDLVHMGLTTKAGDIIMGDLRPDGYLQYRMAGNGIIASSHTFTIPPKDFQVLQSGVNKDNPIIYE